MDFVLDAELDENELEDNVVYEVWAIGYDSDNKPTDDGYLLNTFKCPDDAIYFIESSTISEIIEIVGDLPTQVACFSIEVETVVEIEDEPINIGTIYRKTIYYNVPTDLALTSLDYEIMSDGTLKVKNYLLEKFKVQDVINVLFVEEKERSILTFKIIDIEKTNNTAVLEFVN